ncbi:MAG TPA: MerR family transcriptional regulator [Gemmatimonadales bacterium]|nr:MerR family transcriptional regulator [Gemmatimonadales bacterium]
MPAPVVMNSDRTYEIHEVSRLTGLAPARLRAWERRYEVVRPRRLPNGYRVYTGEQVALLRAYARLVEAGERIGDLAIQSPDVVLSRVEAEAGDGSPLGALLGAIRDYDRERLEALVAQQLSLRGLAAFAAEIVIPLASAVGDAWATGQLPVAAEHLASEVVVHALKGGLRTGRAGGPLFLAGCLPAERHEWGILATLAMLQGGGWRVQYLGADLPAQEMVEASWKLRPRAVGLSSSDSAVVRAALPALAALPPRLPPDTAAVMGGAGVEPFARQLQRYGYRIGLRSLVSA